ncbi:hypothetical protein Ahy_A03g011770 [Arachis hypogaea]|uniref:Uncharacterized protein n=1 Tax=Arachis hypogaea TaxID=3818 RepID=A0A445DRV0_ARAHY|nr:hypothetical protein Ahy_A03g011770 [Arachis hypogaea]
MATATRRKLCLPPRKTLPQRLERYTKQNNDVGLCAPEMGINFFHFSIFFVHIITSLLLCAISYIGLIVSTFGDHLNEELPTCLPVSVERMENEITHRTTVKAFAVIAASPLRVDLSCSGASLDLELCCTLMSDKSRGGRSTRTCGFEPPTLTEKRSPLPLQLQPSSSPTEPLTAATLPSSESLARFLFLFSRNPLPLPPSLSPSQRYHSPSPSPSLHPLNSEPFAVSLRCRSALPNFCAALFVVVFLLYNAREDTQSNNVAPTDNEIEVESNINPTLETPQAMDNNASNPEGSTPVEGDNKANVKSAY